MAESRSQQLQREYMERLASNPPAPVKKDVSTDYRDRVDQFWIYKRPFKLLYPVLPPHPMEFTLNWNEINQVKYGKNTFHYGK